MSFEAVGFFDTVCQSPAEGWAGVAHGLDYWAGWEVGVVHSLLLLGSSLIVASGSLPQLELVAQLVVLSVATLVVCIPHTVAGFSTLLPVTGAVFNADAGVAVFLLFDLRGIIVV